MTQHVKKWLLIFLLANLSPLSSRTLSQLEERALGEYVYRAEGPNDYWVTEFENYFLYELTRVCDLAHVKLDHPLTLRVIDSNTVNAHATSGSFIFIYTGIIKQLTDVSEIMAVLCHELTHTKEHHIRRSIQARSETSNQKMLLLAAFPMVLLLPGLGELFYAMAIDQSFIQQQQFSQQMEYEADEGALELLRASGFNPNKLITAFESLGRYQDMSMMPSHFSYYSSHPLSSDRIARIKRELRASPDYVLALSRSELDYALLQSRLYQPDEQMPQDERFTHLIHHYREQYQQEDVSRLLKTYPNSVLLRLDRLEQLIKKQQWAEAKDLHEQQLKNDRYWNELPLVQSCIAIIDGHQLTEKEFIRKYQSSLLKTHINYDMLKHLAHCYKTLKMDGMYFVTQAKYYVEAGEYEIALKQLQHQSVQLDSAFAESIKNEAELMIGVNRRLRSI